MAKRLDLTGHIYGELKVIDYSHTDNGASFWNVLCSCGNSNKVRGANLRGGHSTTCGRCIKVVSEAERQEHIRIVKERRVRQKEAYDLKREAALRNNPRSCIECKKPIPFKQALESKARVCSDECKRKRRIRQVRENRVKNGYYTGKKETVIYYPTMSYPKPKPMKQDCLGRLCLYKADKSFISTGKFNRLCPSCSNAQGGVAVSSRLIKDKVTSGSEW